MLQFFTQSNGIHGFREIILPLLISRRMPGAGVGQAQGDEGVICRGLWNTL